MSHQSFAELVRIMARLRAKDGCPWDREQTHASLKPYMLEEAYEALEAIDAEDDGELCKELGDVLLQVVFHAQIAAEEQRFDIDQVAQAIADKLIRRHPHVFGDVKVDGAEQVLTNWEQIKRQERQDQTETPSVLDGVPKQLPALLRAQRIQHKASKVGFDWPDAAGPLDKISEELAELRRAVQAGDSAATEDEFGDLLFALVNLGRFLKLTPEEALRGAVEKFERRFRAVEEAVAEQGSKVEDLDLAALDRIWDQVKAREAN